MILSSAGNCISGLVGREAAQNVKRVNSLFSFLSCSHERRRRLPLSHLFTSTIFLKVFFSSLATNAKPLPALIMESTRSSKRLRTSFKKKPKKIAIEGNIGIYFVLLLMDSGLYTRVVFCFNRSNPSLH